MHVELDHLFVCASPGAPGLRNSFGSVCGKVLQICIQVKAQQIGVSHLPTLSVSDGTKACNECTRRTLLGERWSGRERETSPFGSCVRPARVPYIQPPIPAWEYRPSCLPDPGCIHFAETGAAEPDGDLPELHAMPRPPAILPRASRWHSQNHRIDPHNSCAASILCVLNHA
jgi:hypothetical protein